MMTNENHKEESNNHPKTTPNPSGTSNAMFIAMLSNNGPQTLRVWCARLRW